MRKILLDEYLTMLYSYTCDDPPGEWAERLDEMWLSMTAEELDFIIAFVNEYPRVVSG